MLIRFLNTSNDVGYINSDCVVLLDWYDDKRGKITIIKTTDDNNIETFEPIDEVAARINAVKLETLMHHRKDA